ncbi:Hypothetical protein PBC10988_23990 [Planctomycetales bacterium 10988]|nr:Hypothetical protein PBC10988_23990 [Planctomycetales bacterium 10988]
MESFEHLLAICRKMEGIQNAQKPSPELIAASEGFMRAFHATRELPERAFRAIALLPPTGAAWIAVLFGSCVERGLDPTMTGPGLWNLLLSWLELFPPSPESEEEDEDEEAPPELNEVQAKHAEALPMLCQAVVSHVARMPEFWEQRRRDWPLHRRLGFLKSYVPELEWILTLLNKRDGRLMVVHGESGRVLEAHYQNVANCFHLFSLLQIAIGKQLPGGREPDPQVVATVTNMEGHQSGDSAWWHYGSPFSKEANIAASIWGEGHVDEIPEIDGYQVMILWPMIVGHRSWDAGFFGPAIESAMPKLTILRELPRSEAQSWCQRLSLQPKPKKRFWPFG